MKTPKPNIMKTPKPNIVSVSTGDVSGSNIAVGNNISQVAGSGSSIELPAERAKQLELLEQLCAKLGEHIASLEGDAGSSEPIATLQRDFESLKRELGGKKPRRKFYEVTLEGLEEAAKALGTIGKPILETTAQLLPLLKVLFA